MGVDPFSNNKPWELSLYELNRQPQKVINDDTEIAIKPRSLHKELMCPICLEMLKTTMTTKECLHRFCSDCIITALRSGNKECPTCRKKLVSKRSLRPDPNFDMLITKIYASRDEYEAHNNAPLGKQAVIAGFDDRNGPIKKKNKVKKSNSINQDSSNGDSETHGHGKKSKTNHDNNSNKDGDMDDTEPESCTSSNTSYHNNQTHQEIELVFKPVDSNSDDDGPATRFLKTTTNATVDHLIKYLTVRHFLENNINDYDKNSQESKDGSKDASLFTIYLAAGIACYQPLAGQTTLEQINEKYWRYNKPLELFYAYKSHTQT